MHVSKPTVVLLGTLLVSAVAGALLFAGLTLA